MPPTPTRHPLPRRALLGAAAAASVLPRSRPARAQDRPVIRIGVLGDQSGPYRDFSGPVSVACAQQAVADFGGDARVEVLVGDRQNKPDIGRIASH